jgi:hypothetical protein
MLNCQEVTSCGTHDIVNFVVFGVSLVAQASKLSEASKV